MAAAARAEARKKAILSRGTDRLARLTTSARGEDGGGVITDPVRHVSAPSTQNFLGEESTSMPDAFSSPPRRTMATTTTGSSTDAISSSAASANLFEALSNSSATTNTPHNPSAWLPEQHQQFMQALLHASAGAGTGGNASLPGLSSPIGDPTGLVDLSAPPIDNPFASLMGLPAGDGGIGIGPVPPGMKIPPRMQPLPVQEPKPKTALQKILPLLHLVAVWCLLAYFALWAEPKAYAESRAVSGAADDGGFDKSGAVSLWRQWVVSLWGQWAELGRRGTVLKGGLKTFRMQIVPFFWAFTTLEIILHSLRIFAGFDAVQPPWIVAFALPHLPPPIPSIIINSLKYLQMGSLFLDDLSGLVVGIGFIIYFSGWFASSS